MSSRPLAGLRSFQLAASARTAKTSDLIAFSSPRGAEVISTGATATEPTPPRCCSRPLAGLRSFQPAAHPMDGWEGRKSSRPLAGLRSFQLDKTLCNYVSRCIEGFSSPRGAEVISTVGIESGRYSDFVVFSSPRGAEVISTLQPITSTLSFRACSRPLAGLRSFQHENVVVRIYSDYDCTFSSPRGAEVISTLWPSVRTRAIIVVLPVCHKHRFGRARYILTRGTYTRVSRPSTCSI